MAWIYLLLSGLFEIGFATSLKLSQNFTQIKWVISFLIFGAFSFFLLSKAIKTIEIGTAYAVWTGIGVVGTIILGAFIFNEAMSWQKIMFLSFIVFGIIGLKMQVG
jgi:quaternary ammonium compound-resistance protein SugE